MTPLLKVAITVMGVIIAYMYAVTFLPIPPTGIEHSKTIVPFFLGTGLGTYLGYYWGSSNDTTKPKQPTESKET